MADIDINKIARFITDDPDIFNEENKPSSKQTKKPEEDEFENSASLMIRQYFNLI